MSVGDVIALIGLMIAMQAIFSAIYYFMVQNYLDEAKAKIATLERRDWFAGRMVAKCAEALIQIRSAMQCQNGLIARLIRQKEFTPEMIGVVERVRLGENYRIEKAVQGLIIYSDDPVAKASAFRQISEKYGDAADFQQLIKLLEYEEVLREDLARAVKTLKKRLNEGSRPDLGRS